MHELDHLLENIHVISDSPIVALLVVLKLLFDHSNHDLVRDQLALVHDLLRLLAKVGLLGNLRAQHVSGRQMTAAKLLFDLWRLRSLAYTATTSFSTSLRR